MWREYRCVAIQNSCINDRSQALYVDFNGAEAELAGIHGGFERGDHYIIEF